jgi:hypothetical protein
MAWNFEKSVTRWSGWVMVAGMLLIAAQLAAQLSGGTQEVVGDNAAPGKAVGTFSSYIGIVVLLAGAILMALVVLTSRRRSDRALPAASGVETSETAADDCASRIAALEAELGRHHARIDSLESWASRQG